MTQKNKYITGLTKKQLDLILSLLYQEQFFDNSKNRIKMIERIYEKIIQTLNKE